MFDDFQIYEEIIGEVDVDEILNEVEIRESLDDYEYEEINLNDLY